jgi:hypothetical protein
MVDVENWTAGEVHNAIEGALDRQLAERMPFVRVVAALTGEVLPYARSHDDDDEQLDETEMLRRSHARVQEMANIGSVMLDDGDA